MQTCEVSRVRVAFVIDRYLGRGAGTEGQLRELACQLRERGVLCRLLVLQSSEYLENAGFPAPWQAVGRDRLADPRTWWQVWREGRRLRRDGFRVAHVFFNDASILCPPMFALAGLRTVISRRDMGFWYTTGYIRALRVTRRWVRACVANSTAVADVTCRTEGIPRKAVRVIYNGMSMTPLASDPVPDLKAFCTPGSVTVMVVANIRPIKRIGDLIEAAGRLREEHPCLRFVVVGGGDSHPLQRLARELGIADRVLFLGSRDDVASCLAYADIGALCSESEGFSNAVMEYMRAGLPTVCTNAGGNPEAIEHGVCGLLYPVGDVDALTAHIGTLARDSNLRRRLGAAAALQAFERFSIERMVSDHVALYCQVAEER